MPSKYGTSSHLVFKAKPFKRPSRGNTKEGSMKFTLYFSFFICFLFLNENLLAGQGDGELHDLPASDEDLSDPSSRYKSRLEARPLDLSLYQGLSKYSQTSQKNKKEAREEGLIPLLAERLSNEAFPLKIRIEIAWILTSLAYKNSENQSAIGVEENIFTTFIQLGKHKEAYGCVIQAIRNLCDGKAGNQEGFYNAGALDFLTQRLKGCCLNPAIKAAAIEALALFSLEDEFIKKQIASNPTLSLVTRASLQRSDPDLKRSALWALSLLAEDHPLNKRDLQELGIPRKLFEQRNAFDRETKRLIFVALCALTKDNSEALQDLLDQDAIGKLDSPQKDGALLTKSNLGSELLALLEIFQEAQNQAADEDPEDPPEILQVATPESGQGGSHPGFSDGILPIRDEAIKESPLDQKEDPFCCFHLGSCWRELLVVGTPIAVSFATSSAVAGTMEDGLEAGELGWNWEGAEVHDPLMESFFLNSLLLPVVLIYFARILDFSCLCWCNGEAQYFRDYFLKAFFYSATLAISSGLGLSFFLKWFFTGVYSDCLELDDTNPSNCTSFVFDGVSYEFLALYYAHEEHGNFTFMEPGPSKYAGAITGAYVFPEILAAFIRTFLLERKMRTRDALRKRAR